MQQVVEFLLVLAFGVRLGGPHDAHPRGFKHPGDVIGRSFSSSAETRHELPPYLFDFGRGEPRHGELAGNLQDEFLFGRVVERVMATSLQAWICAIAGAGGGPPVDGFRDSSVVAGIA